MEIFLIRHTSVAVDKDVCYGQSDVALADSFEQEKQKLHELISPLEDLAVYSSPLTRCRLLAESLPVEHITYDDRLKEYHFGQWEMKRWHEIDAAHLQRWMDDYVNVCATEGESYLQLHERVSTFWHELLQQSHRRVALVTHGGVVRSILAGVLGMPLNKSFTMEISYGGVSLVKIQQGFAKVMYVNR